MTAMVKRPKVVKAKAGNASPTQPRRTPWLIRLGLIFPENPLEQAGFRMLAEIGTRP